MALTSNDDHVDSTTQQGNDSSKNTSTTAGSFAQLICQERKLIAEAEQRIKTLEQAHKRHIERASLMVNADRAWNALSTARARDVDVILMAITELPANRQPRCLQWDKFDSCFSKVIQHNRQIFLARLQHVPDLASSFIHEPFPVPTRFRNDKEVMMLVCGANSQALSLCSKTLKDDRDVVLAAISQEYHFAPTALQYASPKLKNDRRIARAALGREYGIRAFKYLSKKLQEDTKLALQAIKHSGKEYSTFNEHLSDLPPHFRDDEEVVLEAVRHRGSNLRYVTDPSLLQDYDIIYQACASDGAALEFVLDHPSDALSNMLSQEDNLLMILRNGGCNLLEKAPKEYLKSSKICWTAVKNGYAGQLLNWYYHKHKPFLLKLLAASNNISGVYECLDKEIRHQQDVILEVCRNPTVNDGVLADIVRCHADFLTTPENMPLFLDIIDRGVVSFLGKHSLEERMNTKDFVLQVCSIDGICLQSASEELQRDTDCLLAALNSPNPIPIDFLVEHFPKAAWRSNTSLVERIVELAANDTDLKDLICQHISVEVWRNRGTFLKCLQLGWSQRHLPYMWGSLSTLFQSDEEVVLMGLANERQGDANLFLQLFFYGPLANNREFVERAIEVNPLALAFCSQELRYDYDLLLLAIGSSQEALQAYCCDLPPAAHNEKRTTAELVNFATKVRARLAIGDAFVVHFLGGICIQSSSSGVHQPPPRKRTRRSTAAKRQQRYCHLSLLDCGPETGTALKRLIGDYANIPLGREYKLLRGASKNLAFWGY